MTTPAPTSEVGYTLPSTPGWAAWVDPREEVAALKWPQSNVTYHRMRTDSQIDALLLGVWLPVRRRKWRLNPNGARDEVTEQISTDLGLPIKGAPDQPLRGRKRFSHDDHLRHALLAQVYGHMFMEQVGVIDDDLAWRLRRLAPRMPTSISKINVARDGGLESIEQWESRPWDAKPIPVSQLVGYTWEREGGDWTGRSMLRSIYRNWLVKDRLIRIDAMKNERYGVGIPTGTAPPGARDTAKYGQLAASVTADEHSGVGLPAGASIGVEGIKGALPDTLGSIRYHDEAMARKFLEMFMQLGSTQTGSRALGNTFVDFFELSLDAVSTWYATVTNEHVIEDIVDWNWGQEENAPLIEWATDDDEPETLSTADLIALIDNGTLVVDADLDAWIRARYALPDRGDAPLPTQAGPPVTAAAGRVAAHVLRTGAGRYAAHDHPERDDAKSPRSKVTVKGAKQTVDEDTVGHRDPFEHEVRAAVDFDAMQRAWQEDTESLVDAWSAVRGEQIEALVTAVSAAVGTGNPAALASVAAPVLGGDLIGDAMMRAAEEAVAAARAEALAQGVTIPLVDMAEVEPLIRARANAVAVLMARALSESAARQALLRYGVETLDPDEVGEGVRAHLEELTPAYLNDQLGGAITQAQNTGRRLVIEQRPARVYASELLDQATCERCAAVDGTRYDSLADAEKDYATGGFNECLGGPRCRGTLVAVYDESEATT